MSIISNIGFSDNFATVKYQQLTFIITFVIFLACQSHNPTEHEKDQVAVHSEQAGNPYYSPEGHYNS